jgi:hypothetical protein
MPTRSRSFAPLTDFRNETRRPTRHQSQRPQPSRSVLAHGPRRLRSWLIFDVRAETPRRRGRMDRTSMSLPDTLQHIAGKTLTRVRLETGFPKRPAH